MLLVHGLVFFSGLAGLVYETLWMKQLGLLFGNTSHAAAATFAAFFAGLAVGGWFWGRRCVRPGNALRTYAWLEAGIGLSALFYFAVLGLYYRLYPFYYQHVGGHALLLVKFALALLLIFPPAFCMGGTIPVMGQHLIRRRSAMGAKAALLYGINTLGAALGAFLAGFFLPPSLGFRLTCIATIVLSFAIATVAHRLSRDASPDDANEPDTAGEPAAGTRTGTLPPAVPDAGQALPRLAVKAERWVILLVCFLSGFGVLALEVLWTRAFAQILENSVYTFSAILVIFLLCLAGGALISSRLARLRQDASFLLSLILLLGGIAVVVTPFVFMDLTHSFQILALRDSWGHYVQMIFKIGFLAVGPSALLLGIVFPLVMKSEERYAVSAGRSLGLLACVNTVGAILGSLLCGFVFLERFGMWRTMQLIACLYLAVVLILPAALDRKGVVVKAGAVVFLVLLFTVLSPVSLPVNSVDPLRQDQEILETWEGSDCTVAAARDAYGLSIKINSHYGLGSTGAFPQEQLQSDIPLVIHPQTRSIFFLGMGTGISAGSALEPPFTNVERIVVCELVPEVITAARKYMTDVDGVDFTRGLFSDPRATILAEDGRHYLMAAGDRFDMVNADLFVPFRSGAGSLYSKEHFESVKAALEPDGMFFQWLPLYQVTEYEFKVITRTMLEVFDQVSLWRNNFQPGEEVVVLAGQKQATPLPACNSDNRADRLAAVAGKSFRDLQRLSLPFGPETIPFFYCGNVTVARELFDGYPVNTDDKPVIEYMAPRSYRGDTGADIPWFVGPRLMRLVDALQERCPPADDPLLANRSAAARRLPLAGAAFHRARIWEVIGREAECRKDWQRFVEDWVNQPSR